MRFTRITVDPEQMGGIPCIRRMRIPVASVVAMVADRMTESEILELYPDLDVEDIAEALHYAAEAVREWELPLQDGRTVIVEVTGNRGVDPAAPIATSQYERYRDLIGVLGDPPEDWSDEHDKYLRESQGS